MELLSQLIDIFLHLDVHLNAWAASAGPWLYVGIFAVIFCETGLVVTPFLPGDSLLFACGALAAHDGGQFRCIDSGSIYGCGARRFLQL